MASGKWLALSMAVLTAFAADAAEYIVDGAGSDENLGTTDAPFATLGKAANAMRAGDTCTVHAGIYRETARPSCSGADGRSLVFRAAPGENVLVSGSDIVTGWENDGGVFRAKVDGPVSQVFVDGRMLNEARWPNAPLDPMQPVRATAEAGTGHDNIVDADLPDIDLTGARLTVLPGAHWVSWTRPVLTYDRTARSISFKGDWGQDWAHEVKEGSLYFLFGLRGLLDAPGEWFFDESERWLYVMPPEGTDIERSRAEVKRREIAFDMTGRQYVRVEGFRIFAATVDLTDAAHCVVENCHFRYVSHFAECGGWASMNRTGIVVGGHDNQVSCCSVVHSSGNGVTLTGENNSVENCLIRNVDYAAVDCAAIWAEGRGNAVLRNTMYDTGRSVLVHRTLKAGRIEFNDMFRAGLLTTDLGITYCFQTDGEGTVIAHNWVHDNKAAECGVGIYVDNASSRFVIHHNVSWRNPNSGIRLNTPSHDNAVFNNSLLGNGDSLNFWGADNNRDQAGCQIFNNIFTDKVVVGDGVEADHNFSGSDPGIVNIEALDFSLKQGSPCIDAGKVVEGLTEPCEGVSPDLGACEYGEVPWKAGHDWGEPPEF